ncbi:putative ABC transporter ATP-binding protein [Symmachiella dynata]|nr:ABC transporter ATP-binding protein [Symmachiella dynata]QDT49487.1 putative ABC transporter ATP-binding protein [Symmachiella dynata]
MATTATQTLFQLSGVSKTYRMGEVEVPVLHDVDLEIYAGEIMVIVGPSGSGKSTLLNIIGGIDSPTAGDVLFQDRDLAQLNERELTAYRREHVGFVFQFYNLVPTLTARENVLVSTEISRTPMDVDEVLEMVGLGDRKDHFPSQLSGGEQQRVAIARALAKDPTLLLCDEPTGALDLSTGRMVLELLDRLCTELGKTVVLITHNNPISHLAHRVVKLGQGTIAEARVNTERTSPHDIQW